MITRFTFTSHRHTDIAAAHLTQGKQLATAEEISVHTDWRKYRARNGAPYQLTVDAEHRVYLSAPSDVLYEQTLFGGSRLLTMIEQTIEILFADQKLPFNDEFRAEIRQGEVILHELGVAALISLNSQVSETTLLTHLQQVMRAQPQTTTRKKREQRNEAMSVGVDNLGAIYLDQADYRITLQPASKRLRQNRKYIGKRLGETGVMQLTEKLADRYWVEVLFREPYLTRHDATSPKAWKNSEELKARFIKVLNGIFPMTVEHGLTAEQEAKVQQLRRQQYTLVKLYFQGGDVREGISEKTLNRDRQLILDKTGIDILQPLATAEQINVQISGSPKFTTPPEARSLITL